MNNLLEVQGLCKSYATFALRDVSFEVPRGYIMGFIGSNGAGKTTTIKLLLNIISRDAGRITIFGEDMDAAQNERIGVVKDTPMYVDVWNLHDVERAIAPFYSSWDSSRYAEYLKQFSLDAQKKVQELSRGMKVKLQIAVALSHNAQLLLLDEPTSGLDPVARDEICDLLREFISDENRSVMFSTHITSDLDKVADYITFIQNGSIIFAGEKDALLDKYLRVTGGNGDLSAEQKKLILGYREHSSGFDGMIEAYHAASLPNAVIKEEISLDEIIIYMNKEAQCDVQTQSYS